MRFRHERIDASPPTQRLTFCETTDLTGNGRPDVIVGGKGVESNLWLFGSRTSYPNPRRLLREKTGIRATNVFWYENPGWERHAITDTGRFEVGAAVGDITGDGRDELVVGRTVHHPEVYWYQQPDDPRDRWHERLLTERFEMYHDIRIADIDDDGEPEVVGLSQEAETVFYYDVPDDPTQEPWPDACCHVLADDLSVEGAEIGDIDGDGRTELIAGTNLFSRRDDGTWERESLAEGWDDVRVATADLDGDGRREVVFAEGDSPAHGTHPGRLAVFDTTDWEPTFLHEDLFCPHSLQIADITGSGHPDVYVSEMGLGENDDPTHLLYANTGDGTLEQHVIARGTPSHEAKVVDMTGNGRPDVVGKSFTPTHHVDVWYNEE